MDSNNIDFKDCLKLNCSLAKKQIDIVYIKKMFAIFIILVYGTLCSPKSAIPSGIPRFPVFPIKAVAKKIFSSVFEEKINFE